MSKKVLVKWNKPNVWSIATGIGDGSVVQLVPGVNHVPVDQWDLIKNHPEIKARQELDYIDPEQGKVKMLVLVKPTVKIEGDEPLSESKKEEKEVAEGLSDLNVDDARKLVRETYNTQVLRDWAEDEARGTVLKQIEKQLEKIEKEREKKKDENDENNAE